MPKLRQLRKRAKQHRVRTRATCDQPLLESRLAVPGHRLERWPKFEKKLKTQSSKHTNGCIRKSCNSNLKRANIFHTFAKALSLETSSPLTLSGSERDHGRIFEWPGETSPSIICLTSIQDIRGAHNWHQQTQSPGYKTDRIHLRIF